MRKIVLVLAVAGMELGLAACGLSYWWAFLDPDRQFLHDRLARTRLVRA